MKLSKVANFAALQTVGYVISGLTDVYIYSRNHGVRERDIYKGLFKDFSFEDMRKFERCKVTELLAEENVVCIGIEE